MLGGVTIPAFLLSFLSFVDSGQHRWLLGLGVSYDNYTKRPGLNPNVTYRLIANLFMGPDVTFMLKRVSYLNGVREERREIEYNFNANQLIHVNETWAVYPMAGVNLSKETVQVEGQPETKQVYLGLNIGGGLEAELKTFKLFFEAKYVTEPQRYDVTLGFMFRPERKYHEEQVK